MIKNSTAMLWFVAACMSIAGASGGRYQKHYQNHRKDIVIKHLETTTHSVSYNRVYVHADMTWLWVDTHSQRKDFLDERVCLNLKLQLALMKAVKHCESRNIPFSEKKDLGYFYTCIAKFFQEKDGPGPFYDGRDWVLLRIHSIQFDKTAYYLNDNYGDIVNPYYKYNRYFKDNIIPNEDITPMKSPEITITMGPIFEYPAEIKERYKKRETEKIEYEKNLKERNEIYGIILDEKTYQKKIAEIRQWKIKAVEDWGKAESKRKPFFMDK